MLLLVIGLNAMAQQKIKLHSADKAECVSSDMKSLQASFSFSTIEAEDYKSDQGIFSWLSLPNTILGGNVGEPQIPVINELIAVPFGATPRIEITSFSTTDYSLEDYGMKTLVPRQQPVHKNQNLEDVPFVKNEAAYQTRGLCSEPKAVVEVDGTMRGVRLGNMTIEPVCYDPVNNIIRVFNDIEVTVHFEGADIRATEDMLLKTYSPAFEPVYERLFNNNVIKSAYTDHPDLYNTPVRILVICYSGFRGNEALNNWLQWKLQKGYAVDIFYTSETGTTASAIASFIKTKYNASVAAGNAYTYLIVIGDTGQVPYYMVKNIDSSIGNCASDLGYASVNFSTSTSNYFPDMYYSRMSVENTTHLTNYINKVLTYEKYEFADGGNYLNNVILVGGWDNSWTSRVAKPTINYAKNYYFNSSNTTYGGFSNGTINATISTSSSAGYSGTNNGVYNGINDGVCFLNYTAHGDKQEWTQPLMTAAQVATLTNTGKYFFGVGNCCLSGNFNNTTTSYSPGSAIGANACFGETMIRVPNAGAIAYVGCSPYSYWYEDFYWAVGAHSYSQGNYPTTSASSKGVYDAMFDDANWNSASALLYLGNLAVQQAVTNGNTTSGITDGDCNNSGHYYFQFYHTFGDGSIMPYITKPEVNTVTIPSTVTPGSSSITVNAVAGSYVAVTDNSSVIYGVGVANSSGVATVNFTENIPGTGTLYVVVTRQQYQPYFGTIQIVGGTQYNITVTQPQHGTISAPAQAYANTTVTLTATPETGYCLSSWTVKKGSTNITVTNNQFTMPEGNVTVTATFVQGLEVTLANVTNGSISADPVYALQGTTINLTATPADGYEFDNWVVYKTADPNTTVTVTGNSFTMPNYPVTVSANFVLGPIDLTVYAGTATNQYIPMYGYYFDDYTKSECIIPASQLTAMNGSTISAITFYPSSVGTTNSTWTSTSQTVFLKEVSNTTLGGSFSGTTGATTVKQGLLEMPTAGSPYTITFDAPYTYNGGNLLIGVYNTDDGSYNNVEWYGTSNLTSGVSAYGNNGSNLNNVSYTAQSFLPKTTFTYLPSITPYISLAPATATILTGLTETLTATYGNVSGTPSITYSSSNTSVATVSGSGTTATVTAVAPGTATITASMTVNGTPYIATCAVTVENPSYCTPNPTSIDGKGITTLTFGSGDYVVNNSNSNGLPASSPYYGDYTSMVGGYEAGETATVTITYSTGSSTVYSYGTIIWVDWNKNYTFEDNEIVYTGTSAQGSNGTPQVLTATFTIPTPQAANDYRMRIAGTDSYFDSYIGGSASANHDPCFTSTYAVCHDYTLRVLAASSEPSISLTPATATVIIGSTETLTASAHNVSGTPTITYNSSNTSVATVSGSGTTATVTGVSVGTATITANMTVNGTAYTATCDITVEEPSACEGFENGLGEWTVTAENSNYTWVRRAGTGNTSYASAGEGSYNVGAYYSSSVNTYTYLTLNTDLSSFTDKKISFKYINPSWAGDVDNIYLQYSTDGTNYTNLASYTSGASSWTQVSDLLIPDEAKNIRFAAYGNYGYGAGLDEICLEYSASSCPKPTGLALSGITAHGVSATWNAETGDVFDYAMVSGTNIDPTTVTTYDGSITATGSTCSMNWNNLIADNDYTVVIRKSCDNDEYSQAVAQSFTTEASDCPKPTNVTASNITINSANVSWDGNANSYNVQYATATVTGTTLEEVFFDGFENGIGNWTTYAVAYTSDATNWKQYDATNFSSGSVTNHTGNYVAMSRSYDGSTDRSVDNWLVSPQMTLGDVVKFWVNGDNANYQEYYAVYVSTGTNAISDFELVDVPELAPGDGAWAERTVNLSAYAGQQGYVAIRHTDYAKDFLLVDDFGVYNTVNTYSYGAFTTLPPTTETSCNISGLSAETLYVAQVQADCGSTDGISGWSSVYFTTPDACSAPTDLVSSDITATTATLGWADNQDSYNVRYRKVYFYEGFEGENLPTGWSSIDANNDGNTWSVGHATTHSGNNGAANISFIYNTTGTTPDDYLVSPLLDLQGTLRVWLSGFGDSNEEHFAIYISTSGNTASDFTTTLVGETTTTNEYVEYTADLSSYAGQQGYIAIRHFNCTDQRYLYVDDFGLYGSEGWVTVNPSPTDATTTLTGLQPNSAYEWQLQGVGCDGNGSNTEWSVVEMFETDVDPHNVYFNEGSGVCETGYLYGSTVTLPMASSDCQSFIGWTTDPVGNEVSEPNLLYPGGSSYLVTEDHYLYAVYTDGATYTTYPECCTISELPYSKDFEEPVPASAPTPKTEVKPSCMIFVHPDVNMVDSSKMQLYEGHNSTENGNYSMYLRGRGIFALPKYSVTTSSTSSVNMSFYLTQTKCKHQLLVGLMTDLTDESTFTPLATFDNGCSTEMQYYELELAANSDELNGKYIAFRNIINPTSNTEDRSYNWLDDIRISLNESSPSVCAIDHTYSEDFENITANTSPTTGVQPECWRKAGDPSSLTTSVPQVSYNTNGNGSYNLYMSGQCTYVMPQYVDATVALNTQVMNLTVRQKKYAHELEVGVMSDPSDESTFELVAVINNGNTTTPVACTVDFTTYEGTGSYIAFRNTVVSGSSSDISYNWIDDISFSDKVSEVCGIEVRYEENFDGMTSRTKSLTGVQPECWTLATGTSLTVNQQPQVYYNSNFASSGSYSLYMSIPCLYVMPEIISSVNVNELQMSLTVKQKKFSHQLEIGVMDDPTDESTFVLITTINNGDNIQPQESAFDFSAYTGSGKYIAFRNTVLSGYSSDCSYNWIDDINISLNTGMDSVSTEVAQTPSENTNDIDFDSYEENSEEPFNAPNAISNIRAAQLSLYPNPTTGKVTLVAEEVTMVEVYSQIGSKLATFTLNGEHVIDLGDLPKGVYILRVTMPEGVAVRKVVRN